MNPMRHIRRFWVRSVWLAIAMTPSLLMARDLIGRIFFRLARDAIRVAVAARDVAGALRLLEEVNRQFLSRSIFRAAWGSEARAWLAPLLEAAFETRAGQSYPGRFQAALAPLLASHEGRILWDERADVRAWMAALSIDAGPAAPLQARRPHTDGGANETETLSGRVVVLRVGAGFSVPDLMRACETASEVICSFPDGTTPVLVDELRRQMRASDARVWSLARSQQSISEAVRLADRAAELICAPICAASGLGEAAPALRTALYDRLYATIEPLVRVCAILEQKPNAHLVVAGPGGVSQYAIADIAKSLGRPVAFALDASGPLGGAPTAEVINALELSANVSPSDDALARVQDALRSLGASVPNTAPQDVSTVVVGSSLTGPYVRALEQLAEAAAKQGHVCAIDTVMARPPRELQRRMAPSAALSPWWRSAWEAVGCIEMAVAGKGDGAVAALVRAAEGHSEYPLEAWASESVRHAVSVWLFRDVPGLIRLGAVLREMFAASPRGVVVSPGQTAAAELACRIARDVGLPSLEAQALFVSSSPRYRRPVADRVAVIDTISQELFVEHFGVPVERTRRVGSMLGDISLREANAIDRRQAAAQIGFHPEKRRVLIATQKGLSELFVEAIAPVAAVLEGKVGWELAVKPHPGEDVDDVALYTAGVEAVAPASGVVVGDVSFPVVARACDIVVTAFSNVAVTAACLGLPVISLRAPDGVAGLDLAKAGLTTGAKDMDELRHVLADLVADVDAGRAQPVPSYLERNPLLMTPGAADRAISFLHDVE